MPRRITPERIVAEAGAELAATFGPALRTLVVYGSARVTEGGAPELLQRLAHTYLGPAVMFPNMPDPPQGFVTRITPERLGGVGPWNLPLP